ncbi:MAG: DUF169 domain-containing protein [Dehalococcoidia bacterium]
MESIICKELKLRYPPIAVVLTNEKQGNSPKFKENGWSCMIRMFVEAARGGTVALDRKAVRCPGGKTGVGFGNSYANHLDLVSHFLSTGKPGKFEGEAYKKTPELAKSMLDSVPALDIPFKYLILKPLEKVDPCSETPRLIIFLANPDQLSALTMLANYNRSNNHSVIVSMGSACSSICLYPFNEAENGSPRAIIGLTDITARHYLDPDILSFTVPYGMFLQMETDVPGSFLVKKPWLNLKERIAG